MLESEPAAHWMHDDLPVLGWKKPGPHGELALLPPGQAQPAMHGVEPLVEAAGHQTPAAHVRHVAFEVAFGVAENVPEGHGPLSWPEPPQKKPGGQGVVATEEPGGQKKPCEHPRHAVRDEEPVAPLKVPHGHWVHVARPVTGA
jgi:hypothetical protein